MQVCISLQTDNHASTPPLKSFLQAGCPSCRPTNSVKALKARKHEDVHHNQIQLFKHAHIRTNVTLTKVPYENSKKYHSQAIKHEHYLLLLPKLGISQQTSLAGNWALNLTTSTYQQSQIDSYKSTASQESKQSYRKSSSVHYYAINIYSIVLKQASAYLSHATLKLA